MARLGLPGAAAVCVAGRALGDIDLHFAWKAWHLLTGLALVARLGLAGAAAVCVAGATRGDIDLHLAWQAWHLATWTFTLRGRRGT